MNGKLQSSDVKNETPYNIPLLINENVISSGISLISLWHTYADEHYRVIWPHAKLGILKSLQNMIDAGVIELEQLK